MITAIFSQNLITNELFRVIKKDLTFDTLLLIKKFHKACNMILNSYTYIVFF